MEKQPDNGARKQVLETYELFEGILIHLPFQDLVRCQRVCRNWRDMTVASATLRQLVFLRPMTDSTSTHLIEYNRSERNTKALEEFEPYVGKLNPIFDLHPIDFPQSGSLPKMPLTPISLASVLNLRDGWEEMFTTQPPVQIIELVFYKLLGVGHPLTKISLSVRDHGGIRFKQVLEQVWVFLRSEGFATNKQEEGKVFSKKNIFLGAVFMTHGPGPLGFALGISHTPQDDRVGCSDLKQ